MPQSPKLKGVKEMKSKKIRNLDLRRNVISVKFNDVELEKIDKFAGRTGRKRSTYIRQVALGYEPKEKPPIEFYDVIKELRYLNTSLNQIAKKAHALNYIDVPRFEREVKHLNDFILETKAKFL